RAVKLTQETIKLAALIGARAVILHGGRIRALPLHRRLMRLVREKKFLTKEYAREKLRAVLQREKAGPLYLERLVSALTPLLALAAENGVHLGLENRERYEDVPSEREILPLLARFNSPYLGYWHDFGHAQIKHNLALLDHADWLRLAGNRIFGGHLHDVTFPNLDHLPPFTGELDYAQLIPLLPAGCPLILEMHPDTPAGQIQQAAAEWRRRFGTS
ncbi:MAG TPA: TIM barrel protein, partial [Chthoniobacterales bacterium]